MNGQAFTYSLTIGDDLVDRFDHVNNAAYLKILEEARWDILNQNGFPFERIQELQVGPVVLEIHIRFRRELKRGQKILIQTQYLKFDRWIGTLEQKILGEDQTLHSQAEFRMGFFDMKTRKLTRPHPDWVQAIGWSNPISD